MKTNFSGLRFPEHLSLGAVGGPTFSTDIAVTRSGHEQRNVSWQDARNRYSIMASVTCCQDFEDILTFFRLHNGRAIGFRFKDWTDYSASNQLIAMSSPLKCKYQLIKRYSLGELSDVRAIHKPVASTVHVLVGGKHYDYRVNHESGCLEFNQVLPENLEIRADFEFDVPVRFDTDELRISSMDTQDGIIEIVLIEIRGRYEDI